LSFETSILLSILSNLVNLGQPIEISLFCICFSNNDENELRDFVILSCICHPRNCTLNWIGKGEFRMRI